MATYRTFALAALSLLCCITATAQKKFFNLTASDVKIDKELPCFTYSVPLGSEYADSTYTVEIEYPEFIDMGEADVAKLKSFTDVSIPEMPVVNSKVVVDRKKGILYLSFIPFVYKDGKYRKLVSFMLNVKGNEVANSAHRVKTRASSPAERYASHSVLANGKWAKIRVPETGVYQITDALIKRAGFTDLSKVRVYGYGGALQNEVLKGEDLMKYDDLKEVPTCTVNGKKLFYAQGPVSWSSKTNLKRIRNPYSDYGYYLITQQDGEPLTVDVDTFVGSFYPSYDDYHALHEVDDYAWFEGGRNLFESAPINPGETKTYKIETSGFDNVGKFNISITSGVVTSGSISINDSIVKNSFVISDFGEYDRGKELDMTISVKNLKASNTIKITNTSDAPMRLDYISVYFSTPKPKPDLQTGTFPSPEYVYNITNQDLHSDEACQMIIIIPASQKLKAQAERLKAFHEQHDNMTVRIVPADELFNEFSSGTPDANAYRRYLKMLYDRAENEAQMPKYLLLFGDCAWDNRMNSSAWRGYSPDDFLLCHESENSFSEVDCYVDDGFFCSLDDGEGGDPYKSDAHDIAVGRFPVRNAEDAKVMVDKVIAYVENRNGGVWQNQVVFMGDDGNQNIHMSASNDCANLVGGIAPGFQIKRVMWDVYEIVPSSTGNSYPDVSSIIKKQQNSGALVMNYSGHGAQTSMSHERVLTLSDFENFSNTNLPLWITASCDIAPFDSQTDNIGETAVLNRRGGAIAFFGTTRTVYTNRNKNINNAFMRYLFTKVDGKYVSIGEAQRLAKNYLISPTPDSDRGQESTKDRTQNKLQYSLLGDPALVLNIPTLDVVVDNINGMPVTDGSMASFKAGSLIKVNGHIERNGVEDTSFNGTVNMTVRDSEEEIVCRLNNKDPKDGAETAFVFKDRTKILFNGSDNVNAGRFEFSFVVPMDINYSGNTGLINLFAINNDMTESANGYCDKFTIGGTEDSLDNDYIGPSIYCYLNSPSFTNGDDVNSTPYFVAEINDANGINSSGNGIGHDLQLIIDDDASKSYNLNDNFTFDFGSYQSGNTFYNIPELTPGKHKLKFRAWDILNNSSTAELTFNVVKSLEPKLFSIGVTENPARNSTTFIVNHDRCGSNVNLTIDVMDMSGRLLWQHNANGVSTDSTYTAYWNLNVDGNHKLNTGVYLYRVSVSDGNSSKVSKTKKLIVINNN